MLAIALLGLGSCSSSGSSPGGSTSPYRAVVIVSGVLSESPFTTSDQACSTGYAAGNTDTFLRDHFLQNGLQVFTLPARIGDGIVEETMSTSDGPFGGCPPALPATVTLNSTSTFEVGGDQIRNFVQYLHDEYGLTDVDFVSHSTGGPWTRAGIASMQKAGTPVRVASFSTVGSPWESPMIAKPRDPADPTSSCDGAPVCLSFAKGIMAFMPEVSPLMEQMGRGYSAWSAGLAGSLNGIPLTLIAGTYFTRPDGDASHWPNDAVVDEQAATASNVPTNIVPSHTSVSFPDVHSLFVARGMGLPDETALTWDPRVGAAIVAGIRAAGG